MLIDRHYCAGLLARDLIHAGYEQLIVVSKPGDEEVIDAVRTTARRIGPNVRVETLSHVLVEASPAQMGAAYVCASMELASDVANVMLAAGVKVGASPHAVGVAGVGIDGSGKDYHPCSGYMISAADVAEAIRRLVADTQPHRPVPLWLVGTGVDRGTARMSPTTPRENPPHAAPNTATHAAPNAAPHAGPKGTSRAPALSTNSL